MSTQLNKRRPQKKRSYLPVIIAAAVIVGLIIAAVVTIVTYRPDVDTNPTFNISRVDTTDIIRPDDTSKSDTDTEPSGEKFVRDKNIVNFLVMGRDKAAWNTDVMMLVNFNMNDYSVNVMQIPRDTYIEAGKIHGRINTLVKSMRSSIKDTSLSSAELTDAGMEKTMELLEKSLCISIDGYAIVNLEGFRNVIDILGGVRVNVPFDMEYDDPDQDLCIKLHAGEQVLDGEKAEMFVRFRSGYVQADIGRIDAQKIFLTALFKELKNGVGISNIAPIAEQAIKHITTDLSLADIIYYAEKVLKVDMENMTFMTLPGEACRTTSGAWYYIIHRADTLELINTYFNVFSDDITDGIFDPEKIFTDEHNSVFDNIYNAPATEADVDKADDIDKGGIDIPLT